MSRSPWVHFSRGDIVFLARDDDRARIDAEPFSLRSDPAALMLHGPLEQGMNPESAAGLAMVVHASSERFHVNQLRDDDRRAHEFLSHWGLDVVAAEQHRRLNLVDYEAFWLRFVPRTTYRGVQPWELTDAEFQGDVRFHDLRRSLGSSLMPIADKFEEEYQAYRALRELAYGMAREEYLMCFPEIAGTMASAFEPSPSTARYLRQAALRRGYPVSVPIVMAFPDLIPYARDGRTFERTTPGPDAPERHGFEQLIQRAEVSINEIHAEMAQYQERLARCKSEHTSFGRIYARQLRTLRDREAAMRRQKRIAESTLARARHEDVLFEDPSVNAEQLSLM